jgi:hypothetical protein
METVVKRNKALAASANLFHSLNLIKHVPSEEIEIPQQEKGTSDATPLPTTDPLDDRQGNVITNRKVEG